MANRLGSVNLDALKKGASRLDKSFDTKFFRTNKIKDSQDVRILPPYDNTPGKLPYLVVKVWWIGGKRYVDPATFGGKSPFKEELANVKDEYKTEISEIEALEASKDWRASEEVWFVGLIMDFDYDDRGNPKGLWLSDDRGELYQDEANDHARWYEKKLKDAPDLTFEDYLKGEGLIIEKGIGTREPIILSKVDECVLNGKPTIIDMKVSLAKAVQDILQKRSVQNNSGYGALDREQGYNIILNKSGKGMDTKYSADVHHYPMEISPAMYDHEDLPDIVEEAKKQIKPEAECRAVVRSFYLGEDTETQAKPTRERQPREPRERKVTTNEPVTRESRERKVEVTTRERKAPEKEVDLSDSVNELDNIG